VLATTTYSFRYVVIRNLHQPEILEYISLLC